METEWKISPFYIGEEARDMEFDPPILQSPLQRFGFDDRQKLIKHFQVSSRFVWIWASGCSWLNNLWRYHQCKGRRLRRTTFSATFCWHFPPLHHNPHVQDDRTGRTEKDKIELGGLPHEVTFDNDLSFPSHDRADSHVANTFPCSRNMPWLSTAMRNYSKKCGTTWEGWMTSWSKHRLKRNAIMVDEALNVMPSNLPPSTHQSMKNCKRKARQFRIKENTKCH
jgi:hypothetical protein